MNFPYKDFDEYFNTIFQQPTSAALLATLDEATKNKVMDDARRLYEERMGPNVL